MTRVLSIVFLFLSVGFGFAENRHGSVENNSRAYEESIKNNPLSRFDGWVKEEPYKKIYEKSSLKSLRDGLSDVLRSKDEGRMKDFENFFIGFQKALSLPAEDNNAILLRHLVTELGLVAASDKDGKAVYEQSYGGLAEKMLKECKGVDDGKGDKEKIREKKGDLKLLESLVFQYPFTEAGLEGLDIFATHHLDRGQYELASFYFELLKARQRRLGGALSPLTEYKAILTDAKDGKEWKSSFAAFSERNSQGANHIPLLRLEKFIGDSAAESHSHETAHNPKRDENLYLTAYMSGLEGKQFFKGDFFKEREFKKGIAELEKKGHFNFVKIGPGSFMMGSPSTEEGRDDNETQHKVNITKEKRVLATEATQALYKLVMGSNPSLIEGEDLPVTSVSWDDITGKGGFLEKLNQMDPEHHYRLLTEAEWEYAARGGTQTAYSFGDDVTKLKEYAWFSENSEKKVHPVGQRKANAYGLYDMHGNVWEWTQDYYGAYPSSEVTDPTGPESGSSRVIRSGSWDDDAQFLRSASRLAGSHYLRYGCVGFRLVRESRSP